MGFWYKITYSIYRFNITFFTEIVSEIKKVTIPSGIKVI